MDEKLTNGKDRPSLPTTEKDLNVMSKHDVMHRPSKVLTPQEMSALSAAQNRGKRSSFQITRVVSKTDDSEGFDGRDDSHDTNTPSSDVTDISSITDVAHNLTSEDTVYSLSPTDDILSPFNVRSPSPEPKDRDIQSRFRLVKIDNMATSRRGRWTFADFADGATPVDSKPDATTLESIAQQCLYNGTTTGDHYSHSDVAAGGQLSRCTSANEDVLSSSLCNWGGVSQELNLSFNGVDVQSLQAPLLNFGGAQPSPICMMPPGSAELFQSNGFHDIVDAVCEQQNSTLTIVDQVVAVNAGGADVLVGAEILSGGVVSQKNAAVAGVESRTLGLSPQIFDMNSILDASASQDPSESGASTVAIDNKIEQAMDLVKSHLMFAVRQEVELMKEQIKDLMDRNSQLEYENSILRMAAPSETLALLQQQQPPQHPPPQSPS